MDPVIKAALEAVAEAIETGALETARIPSDAVVYHDQAGHIASIYLPSSAIEVTAGGAVLPAW